MKYIFQLLFMLLFIETQAQSANSITNFSIVDGLVDNYIQCLDVDQNNNLWVGTTNGISKFDGQNWINFNTSDGLIDNNIKAIFIDSNNDVWIGTDFGISYFDGANWTSYTSNDGLANNTVVDIEEDNNGALWFAHSSFSVGVSKLSGATWSNYSYPDLPISGVCDIEIDQNGDKWFSSPLDGVIHYDDISFTNYTTLNGLLPLRYTSILIDKNNNYKWIGTENGLSNFEHVSGSVTNYTRMFIMPPPDTLNPVVDITQDSYGNIWVAIYVGYLGIGAVANYHPNVGIWNQFTTAGGSSSSLAGENITCIKSDLNSDIWVGTSTGLSKIYNPPNNIIDYHYNSKKNMDYNLYNILGKKDNIRIGQLSIIINQDGLYEKKIIVD